MVQHPVERALLSGKTVDVYMKERRFVKTSNSETKYFLGHIHHVRLVNGNRLQIKTENYADVRFMPFAEGLAWMIEKAAWVSVYDPEEDKQETLFGSVDNIPEQFIFNVHSCDGRIFNMSFCIHEEKCKFWVQDDSTENETFLDMPFYVDMKWKELFESVETIPQLIDHVPLID